jgi:hypothetical protein
MSYLLYCLLLFVGAIVLYKPFRFYIFSFVFAQLYENEKLAELFGIRYVSINDWKTTRKETRIYSSGIFVWLLKLITGMDLRINHEVMSKLIRLQADKSRELNMESYFDRIDKKRMNLQELEYFISEILLIETNRAFEILDKEKQQELQKHICIVFDVLNGLSGGMTEGFYMMAKHSFTLYKVSKILKSLPEPERLIIFGPQLSLVTNFTKMIWRKQGIMKDLEPNDFLDLSTKFFVLETWERGYQELVFVRRDVRDTSNHPNNKAFGPTGVVCPGALMTINYIKSILSFLKEFDIKFEGHAKFEGKRFLNITNKQEVMVTFTKK